MPPPCVDGREEEGVVLVVPLAAPGPGERYRLQVFLIRELCIRMPIGRRRFLVLWWISCGLEWRSLAVQLVFMFTCSRHYLTGLLGGELEFGDGLNR